MSKNILLLISEFPPQPGGIGVHAHQLAKGLAGKGFQVQVVCDQRSGDGEEERLFDAEQPFEVVRVQRNRLILWSYVKRIHTAMRLSKTADIVLASGKFSLWTGGLLRRIRKIPLVAILHGTEMQLPNAFLRKLTDASLKRFDTVVAVSQYTKSLTNHLDLKNVCVIPNGFEMAGTETIKKRIEQGPRLITVGNVTQRKGQHNVIRALPVLLKKHPNLQYHIVGIPTNRAKLEKMASDLNVSDAVVFHGRVDEATKRNLLLESDVFVMLSEATASGDVEGFGIAILEANALGLPAIGALGCGIEDAIEDGLSGRLIAYNSPNELEKTLADILENYTQYSQQAVAWSTNFTWDKVMDRYLEVLVSDER